MTFFLCIHCVMKRADKSGQRAGDRRVTWSPGLPTQAGLGEGTAARLPALRGFRRGCA